jgi:hypothetical protein
VLTHSVNAQWLKDIQKFEQCKISKLMKYAIIGGFIPVFLSALNIKKYELREFLVLTKN